MNLNETIIIRVDKSTKRDVMKRAKKDNVRVSDLIREWIETRLNENKFSKL